MLVAGASAIAKDKDKDTMKKQTRMAARAQRHRADPTIWSFKK